MRKVFCENCKRMTTDGGYGDYCCIIGFKGSPISIKDMPIYDTVPCREKNKNNDCEDYTRKPDALENPFAYDWVWGDGKKPIILKSK